jgi:hypothetical protein
MDATIRSDPFVLRATLDRAARAGLELDHARLSRENRRAVYALQRAASTRPQSRRAPIGFAYPNAR